MRKLALHQLSVAEASPLELIEFAAATGCSGVCVVTDQPVSDPTNEFWLPFVDRGLLPEMKQRMRDFNISVDKIEVFPVGPDFDVNSVRTGMEIGAALGAKVAIVLITDNERARAIDNLALFGEVAAEHGLALAIEFMRLTPGCQTLEEARDVAAATGRDNVGISLDVLHFERSGGRPADIAAIDPGLLISCQISDGPAGESDDYTYEAMFARQAAGDGQFPLSEVVAALPVSTLYDVETPLAHLRASGMPPLERARRAVAGARRFLA